MGAAYQRMGRDGPAAPESEERGLGLDLIERLTSAIRPTQATTPMLSVDCAGEFVVAIRVESQLRRRPPVAEDAEDEGDAPKR